MKKFIAFSGGVESTTMCLKYGADAKAIFSDTGWEHQAMYDRIDMVEKEIKKIHPNFEIIKVKNEKHGKLQDYIKTQKFYPAPMARYCTRMFKIEPIDNFLKSQGACMLMIGLNYDEQDRAGNHMMVKTVNYRYPLINDKMTRQDCIDYLKEYDLDPKLPVYMQRGGCVGCFFKSKKEFIAMIHLANDEFQDVVEIEKAIQDKRDKFYSVRDGILNLEDLEKSEETMLFDPDDVYSGFIDIGTPCGLYCHR